jgi:crotonobetainyl-CoA:carnitine CoA-transferase CaiB-like acyl-CoA transferase
LPWGPLQRVADVIDDDQVVANGYITDLATADGDVYRLPTGAVQFDERPPVVRPAPEHGQDTEALLLGLGYGWDDIARLKAAGVTI